MTVNRYKHLITFAIFLLLSVSWLSSVAVGNELLVSKENLKDRIDDPNTLIIDVRTGSDWTSSSRKIKGALRFDPDKFHSWARLMPKGKTIVFY